MLVLAGARLLWSKLTLGQYTQEKPENNSDCAAASKPTVPDVGSAEDNSSVTVESEVDEAADDDEQLLLIEDSVLATQSVMAAIGPPPPSPPPPSFGSSKVPLPLSTSPPPPPPPPLPQSLCSPTSAPGTADKGVQSSMTGTSSSGRRPHFARTVHTFFSGQSPRATANTTDNGEVRTTALVHVEDPEALIRSLAVPLALAAPCRSKPTRCLTGAACDAREASSSNSQASRLTSRAESCAAAAGGDAPSAVAAAAMPVEAGSSVPGFERRDELRTNCDTENNGQAEDPCIECCVYYSVRCCECVVI